MRTKTRINGLTFYQNSAHAKAQRRKGKSWEFNLLCAVSRCG
jgi:hypothetical protein